MSSIREIHSEESVDTACASRIFFVDAIGITHERAEMIVEDWIPFGSLHPYFSRLVSREPYRAKKREGFWFVTVEYVEAGR